MKRGQTIVAKREVAESESERMVARKKIRRRHTTSVVVVVLLLAVLGLIAYMWGKGVVEDVGKAPESQKIQYDIKAQVIDEAGQGQISERMREYIGMLEADLAELGQEVVKVTIPANTSRELFVDLAGRKTFYKVSLDRGMGVTAEDIVRMVKYLKANELEPEYVDVRIEGKAYYK